MKEMIRFEAKRCAGSRETKLVVLFSFLIALGHFLSFCIWYVGYRQGGVMGAEELKYMADNPDFNTVYPACLYEGFIGGEAYTFWNSVYFYILPVLAALPFGWSYFQDETTGYLRQIYSRVSRSQYLTAKMIVTFCSGAVGGALTYILSFAVNALYLPAVKPNEVAQHTFITNRIFMAEWYFSKPWLYFGVYLLIIMLCGGLLAVSSLLISFVARNRLIICMFPFILYLSADYLLMELGLEKYSIAGIINPMMADSKVDMNFPLIAGIFGILLLLCVFSFWWIGCHRKKII